MKSYLKFLSRNKLYTAIEFVGLAVSLAFVILIDKEGVIVDFGEHLRPSIPETREKIDSIIE